MRHVVNHQVVLSQAPEGPLAPWIEGYADAASRQGYALSSIGRRIRLAAGFSRWLGQEGIDLSCISSDHPAQYLRYRTRRVRPHHGDAAALRHLVDFLRLETVIPAETRPLGPETEAERCVLAYEQYLSKARGLAPATILNYTLFARAFVQYRFGTGPEAEARKETGIGIGLADDLRSIRTALVKAKLAGDFEAAFDLALFQMGRAVFARGYPGEALDIAVNETRDRPMTRMNDADFAGWSPGEAMLEDRSHLSFDWLEIEDDGESFAALRALPRAGKEALFAACVARTVKGQLAYEPQARPELEATIARLDIDFAAHSRPDPRKRPRGNAPPAHRRRRGVSVSAIPWRPVHEPHEPHDPRPHPRERR